MNTIKIISIKHLALLVLIAFASKTIAQGQQDPGTGADYSMYQTNIGFQAPKIFDASPSVAALMRFEEIPVDGYSGTPSIGIPIFQSKTTSDKVNLDISLSYHATAITAEEVASFTGLGWSLMAGGSISRTVKGYPDEIYLESGPRDGGKIGIYYRPNDPYGYYSNAYYETLDPANGLTKKVARYKWEAFEQNKFDTEHDLYQYNAMGMSGRFYIKMDTISQELKVVKLDDNRHKIEVNYDGPHYEQKLIFNLNGFTITNTEGIKFVFEEKETVIANLNHTFIQYFDDGDNFSDSNNLNGYPTAFHLTKVYDETGTLLINFNYISINEEVTTHSRTINESLQNFDAIDGFEMSELNQYRGANFARVEPKQVFTGTSTTTQTKKLSKITIPGLGTVDFSYSGGRTDSNLPNDSGAQKLDQVLVKNVNNQQIKKVSFAYNYFDIQKFSPESTYPGIGSGEGPNHLKRLILKEVKEYGSTSNKFNKYELNYKPVDNPSKSTIIKNPWDYLELDENTLAAKQFVTTGVLSEMTLPTGGRVEYEFEPNTYSYWGETMLSTEDFQTNPENIGIDPNNTTEFKKYVYGVAFE